MKGLLFLLILISTASHADDQLALRINQQGIMKILEMAVKYNTNSSLRRTIVIPRDIYKFTIPKKDLLKNPIVSAVNEVSNLNLQRDLDFYLNTSAINITGQVDQKSLIAKISNSTENGFDITISLDMPQVIVEGKSISLCEDRTRNSRACGSGLKSTISSFKVKTSRRPVTLHAKLRVRVSEDRVTVKVVSVRSNLETKYSPDLDVNFRSIDVPKVSIIINDQETELNTTRLREVILKNKKLLGKKLLSFVGDFIASDLAEMMNVYLKNKSLPTSVDLVDYERKELTLQEFFTQKGRPNWENKTPGEILEDQISSIIRNAAVSLSLESIDTPDDKDLQLGGELSMSLNGENFKVRNRLRNQDIVKLPTMNLDSHDTHDVNLAISEPVINGALELVSKTGLFKELVVSMGATKGFTVNSVQIHFADDGTLKAIANSQIDLNQLSSEDNFGKYLKNQWAAFRERNNNNSIIYFPLEITIDPEVVEQESGGVALNLYVRSPFEGDTLLNTYDYPSNIARMKSEVKKGVMEELKSTVGEHTNKAYLLDVTKFMNHSGAEFKPKSISFHKGAYILFNLDIIDIKLTNPKPKPLL